MFFKLLDKIFLFIDFYLVYTAHPLKPDPKAKAKDNTDYIKLKKLKEQAVLFKEAILEKSLTQEEKEIIIGNKKEQKMSKEEIFKNVQEVRKKLNFDKNQNQTK